MTEKHWKEQWEDSANVERKRLGTEPIQVLKQRVLDGKFGEQFALWSAIEDSGDLPAIGWTLFDFVSSNADYLQRYNCARALLSMLACTKYQAADLSIKHMHPEKALAEVEQLLVGAIGART